jgi:hypothetical protein
MTFGFPRSCLSDQTIWLGSQLTDTDMLVSSLYWYYLDFTGSLAEEWQHKSHLFKFLIITGTRV